MFSKATEYALRAVIYIAQCGSETQKTGTKEISRAIGAPESFTAKILQTLRKDKRIVRSVRGPNGGFYITEYGKKLPVRAILKVMKEDDVLEKCVLGLATCSEEKPCPMHGRYKIIKRQLIALFETKTIQYLADKLDRVDIVISNRMK